MSPSNPEKPLSHAAPDLRVQRLLEQLIALPSITPADCGAQSLFAQRLTAAGFACTPLEFGPPEFRVQNLWAIKRGRLAQVGQTAKTLVFAGHTDVVPTGPLDAWRFPPFVPTLADGKLYGRGASDMKASLAAMLVASEDFLAAQPLHAHNVAFLLTSDEEGPSVDGTAKVCEWLLTQQQAVDYCVVGEPTAVRQTGDMIKNGRRGSLSGKLTVHGVQGHIAYPQLAKNPIHLLAPALAELAATAWDAGNAYFPATSWQVSNIHAGTGANNVIPGTVTLDFNFRFCTESTVEGLKKRLCDTLERHGLKPEADYRIDWALSGLPFLTPQGSLVAAAQRAIADVTGLQTELSTTGGTSDGRFIAQICPQVVELGPPNASIHKIDEHIVLTDLAPLAAIYGRLLEQLIA